MFSGLASTGTYFKQIISLSTTPTGVISNSNRVSLVDLLMGLLTNPFFYCIIGVIIVLSILPTFDDD